MLHKAWPPELNKDSESTEKILLNHLLTWPTWPGFLKFFGKQFTECVPDATLAIKLLFIVLEMFNKLSKRYQNDTE
jgi:hypothetical protein